MSRPAVNPNVLLSPVADGYVAFHVADERLYQLNPAAALLVELCDGSRTCDDVASLVGPLVPADSHGLISDWLQEATATGLLVDAAERTANSVRELDAGGLARLAGRLRDEGKTHAAYLCQQQAVELSPQSADLLCQLGELAHIVGKRDAARDAYERYLELDPADAEIRHLLVSLRDQPAPPRVPDECIRQIYERFSTYYESSMCEDLGYAGPQQLAAVIQAAIGGRRGLTVLDLGCGTGLAGEVLRPFAARLVGVDLSAEMLSRARDRQTYDQLEAGELTDWLVTARETFDLIVACDTFIYFGDLRQVIGPASARLNPGGAIAFSVERSEHEPFRLTDSGRYEHHLRHIQDVANRSRMTVAGHRESFLRMEYGKEVVGHFVCLTQTSSVSIER